MSRYWSDIVQQLVPYVPGEQPARTREAEHQRESIRRRHASSRQSHANSARPATRYAAIPTRLRARCETVATHHRIKPEQVFVGNGSDEVLAHTFQALLKHDRPLRFPDITYSFYPTYARLYGVQTSIVPLADDFSIRVDDYLDDAGGVLFPNPNAPTGRALPLTSSGSQRRIRRRSS